MLYVKKFFSFILNIYICSKWKSITIMRRKTGNKKVKRCDAKARLQPVTLDTWPHTLLSTAKRRDGNFVTPIYKFDRTNKCRKPEAQNHVKVTENVRSQFCDDLSASLSKVCQLETQSEDRDDKHVIVPE